MVKRGWGRYSLWKRRTSFGFMLQCRALTVLKGKYPWLRESDSTALQSSLRDLDARENLINFGREQRLMRAINGYLENGQFIELLDLSDGG